MQVLINLVTEPKAAIQVQKKLLDLGEKKATVYEITFGLVNGPISILLPEDFARPLKDRLMEVVSGIVVPDPKLN